MPQLGKRARATARQPAGRLLRTAPTPTSLSTSPSLRGALASFGSSALLVHPAARIAGEEGGREEFARVIRHICDETRPGAERAVPVTDDPDTYGAASPCAAFPPEEARRLADRPGIHLAPRHGSWPGMAETGIGVPMGHGLPARVPDYDTSCGLREAWEDDRNARGGDVDWQFTNADARVKLKQLYPKITA